MSVEIAIRPERPGDGGAIRQVLLSAFPTEQEANLVDRLRLNGRLIVSFVAKCASEIIGQIAFSPVTVRGAQQSSSSTSRRSSDEDIGRWLRGSSAAAIFSDAELTAETLAPRTTPNIQPRSNLNLPLQV